MDIYEANPHVGGFCQTIELWGYRVDLGPHRFFSSSSRVNQLWHKILKTDFIWVRRQTRIFYKKKFFEYPLQPFNTFLNLGLVESLICLLSYCHEKIKPSATNTFNFENWIVSKFGRRLFDIFFKTYTEKLWGLPCHLIDSDFAERKIRQISLVSLVKKFIVRPKTFVEYFAYPKGGTGMTYEKLKQEIQAKNGTFRFVEPVKNLVVDDHKQGVTVITPQKTEHYDFVISTMPMNQLVRALNAPSEIQKNAEELQFRNTILVYLLIKGAEHFTDNWVYVHSQGVGFGRVTNFRNWSPEMCQGGHDTVLCLEYWCSSDDEIWSLSSDQLIEGATQDLLRSQIVKNLNVKSGHVLKLSKTYPVFKVGYKSVVAEIDSYLKTIPSLLAIGRNGSFKYNNQDHSLLMGLKAADQLIQGEMQKWIIFADDYEEDGLIDQTLSSKYDEI